tara:strand:+ start:236 stop:868 length:633 start_codon:yes stop_codon:yes gene_type:complete
MGCSSTKELISDKEFNYYFYLIENRQYYLSNLLEKSPKLYYDILCKAYAENINMKLYINDETCYHNWYSNHVFCLLYCVGDLINNSPSNFYGKTTSISEDLGIKILDKLIELEVNIHTTNTYNFTIMDIINTKQTLTERKNNEKFIKKLIHYYNTESSLPNTEYNTKNKSKNKQANYETEPPKYELSKKGLPEYSSLDHRECEYQRLAQE